MHIWMMDMYVCVVYFTFCYTLLEVNENYNQNMKPNQDIDMELE
jgi:hypothetical protein